MEFIGLQTDQPQNNSQTADVKKYRDSYIVEMRKQDRQSLINKRRYTPINDQGDQINDSKVDLSHLNTVPWGEEMIPKIREFLKMEADPNLLLEYISHLEDQDRQKRHWAIIALRKVLSIQKNNPIQMVIDHNIVPKLVNYMRNPDEPHMQIEATWCITNMASGTTQQTASLVEKGVIPIMAAQLKSQNVTLVEQAIWGVGNIAGDCSSFRDKL